MTLPSGFKAGGSRPKIIIKDTSGATQYTYDSDSGGTQDFKCIGWSLQGGVNSNWGGFIFLISDNSKALVDTTNVRKKSKLKRGWIVEVYLKKDGGSYYLWMKSIIQEAELIPDSPNTFYQRVYCVGTGRKLAESVTNIKRYQLKQSDGLTPDSTDTNTRTSELAKDLINDTDHFAHLGRPSLGFTSTGVDTVDIKLPDFQKYNTSIAQALEELASISACYYGVDQNDDFYFKLRDNTSSGFIATNDFSSVTTINWNAQKYMILKRFPNSYADSITDDGYTIFHASPVNRLDIDQQNTSSNALLNLSSKYYSFPITPTTDTISKISLYLTKTGTLTKDLIVNIIGTDGSSTPEEVDLRKRIIIPASRLQSELGSAKWFEIGCDNLKVTPLTKVWIKTDKYPDAVNYVSIDYQTGTGNYYDSADGVSWTTRTGNAKIRQYTSKTIRVIGENTSSRKSFGYPREIIVPTNDYPDKETVLKALAGYMDTKGKESRKYPNIITSCPETPVKLGQTIRIKDVNSGLDFNVNLIGYSMTSSKGGYAHEILLTIEEWSY